MMTVGIRYYRDRDKPELPAESAHTPQLGWSSQRPRGQWTDCRTARSMGLRRAGLAAAQQGPGRIGR